MSVRFNTELRQEFYKKLIGKYKPSIEDECLLFNRFIYGYTPQWEIFKNMYQKAEQKTMYNDFVKNKNVYYNKLRAINKNKYLNIVNNLKNNNIKKPILLLEYVIENKESIKKDVDKFVDIIIEIINKK